MDDELERQLEHIEEAVCTGIGSGAWLVWRVQRCLGNSIGKPENLP
jgi:hypothetical protein